MTVEPTDVIEKKGKLIMESLKSLTEVLRRVPWNMR